MSTIAADRRTEAAPTSHRMARRLVLALAIVAAPDLITAAVHAARQIATFAADR